MPLPDPHAGELTVEVDHDTYKLLQEAKANTAAWAAEAARLSDKLREEMGDAYAATIDGVKVYTNRPKDQYAEARLIRDYPDLTEHFFTSKLQRVFDLDAFKAKFPDLAAQYRVRSLVEVKGP